MDAAAASHHTAHQQSPVHVIAAGDQQDMANAAATQPVHQGGEVAEGVAGGVIELQLLGINALAFKHPLGIFRVAAAGDQHWQVALARQGSGLLFPLHITAQDQDHLRRRHPRLQQPRQQAPTTPEQQQHNAPAKQAPHQLCTGEVG